MLYAAGQPSLIPQLQLRVWLLSSKFHIMVLATVIMMGLGVDA
jgi:hypothetical protein